MKLTAFTTTITLETTRGRESKLNEQDSTRFIDATVSISVSLLKAIESILFADLTETTICKRDQHFREPGIIVSGKFPLFVKYINDNNKLQSIYNRFMD